MMEKVLCAAIHYKNFKSPIHTCRNIKQGIVLCGHRHAHIIGQMFELTGKRTITNGEHATGEFIQGFLTSENRFVNRKEALQIAKANNQIIHSIPLDEGIGLTSEDIY